MTSSPDVGAHLDGAAALEAHLEAAHDGALDLQRQRRADGALDAARVGRREDLFGRHVRDVLDPVRLVERGLPVRVGVEADRQVGARPAVAQVVEAALVERGGALLQAGDVLAPGGDRVGLVEADRRARPPPRAARRRARRTPSAAQPSFGYATIVQLQRPSVSWSDASATSRIRALPTRSPSRSANSSGSGLPVIAQQRAADLAELVAAGWTSHGGEKPSCVLGGVLDVRAPDVLVGVEDVDVAGAGRVGLARDRAHERRVLDQAR